MSNSVDISNEHYGNGSKLQIGQSCPSKCRADSIKLCEVCFQEVSNGKIHPCKNATENVLKLVEKLPSKGQEQIVASVLKKIDSQQKTSNSDSSDGKEIYLSTGGRKLRVSVNPKEKKNFEFTEESLDNFRIHTSSSITKMKDVTNFIRCTTGRKSVPKNYLQHMLDSSKTLEGIYKHGFYEFDSEISTTKQKRPVVYADAQQLLDAVIEKRNLIGNILIKAMADSGQKFFKTSLTILPEDYSPKTDFPNSSPSNDNQDNDELMRTNLQKNTGKRTLYSQGGSMSKKRKLSSVDRLILLCIVPEIKESYENVKLLFELTGINNIPFKFAADFKLLLIVNGQQTASATFPCPYCFIPLSNLRNYQSTLISTTNENDSSLENSLKLKTFGDLRRDYGKYCLAGKNKKFSRECHSTVNLPLMNEADEVTVLEKCVIPELHILQGFVNHLF